MGAPAQQEQSVKLRTHQEVKSSSLLCCSGVSSLDLRVPVSVGDDLLRQQTSLLIGKSPDVLLVGGKLTAEVTGEVEEEEGVLVIRRIHVSMRLVAPKQTREKVERVHVVYAMSCPLYRTLHDAIRLTSSFELVPS